MTYVLSDDEFLTLLSFCGFESNGVSPYKITSQNKNKLLVDSLKKIKLLNTDEHNNFYLSKTGRCISELFMIPQFYVIFLKKNDNISVEVCFRNFSKTPLWCVNIRSSKLNMNILKIFTSKQSAVDFLREDLFTLKTEFHENFDIDLSLTYKEWLMFELSQMSYMRKQTDGLYSFDYNNESLSDKDIYSEKFLKYLTEDSKLFVEFFSTFENRKAVYDSLCSKNIFIQNEGDETYKYSDISKKWLDNDLIYDSVEVRYSNDEGLKYALLLSLRLNGVVSMYDSGDSMRFVSSKSIPFSSYLA